MDEHKNYTVLVVDDEETLRSTIVFDLKRKKFNVLEADNGITALDLVKSNTVHLVLSDIRMPGGDGLVLLEQVKIYDQTLPVVLMTGFADITVEECLKKGAYNVVEKPFDRKVLMNSILMSLGLLPKKEGET